MKYFPRTAARLRASRTASFAAVRRPGARALAPILFLLLCSCWSHPLFTTEPGGASETEAELLYPLLGSGYAGALLAPGVGGVGGNQTILIAGYARSATNRKQPAYWLNGVRVDLASANSGTDSEAAAIQLVGDDIHLVGTSNNQATYWLNGARSQLPSSQSCPCSAHDLVVENGTVRAVGASRDSSGKDRAMLWTDGVLTNLPETRSTMGSSAHAIQVDGGTTHIVGRSNNYFQTEYVRGARWTNLSVNTMGHVFARDMGIVYGLHQTATDHHAAGYGHIWGTPEDHAMYWLNGVATRLPEINPATNSYAYDVFVDEAGDVYIGGTDSGRAILWHNSTIVDLTALTGGGGAVRSVTAKNGIVYMAGVAGATACYWIYDGTNAVRVNLPALEPGRASEALDIIVP